MLGYIIDQESRDRDKFIGMNPECQKLHDRVLFDAQFEGGNLDRVVMINPNEYDLYMRPDTNSKGHH